MKPLSIELACILVPGGLCLFGLIWLLWRDHRVTDEPDEAEA